MKTRKQLEQEFHGLPHEPIYWAPDETWDEAVKREIDFRYEEELKKEFGPIAQFGSALPWHGRGRRFDPD